MTQLTVEQMIEWLEHGTCGNGVMAPVTLDYEKSTAIRIALHKSKSNTLPLDEIPEGWVFHSLNYYVYPKECWGCILAEHVFDMVRQVDERGTTPAEALRAAIAKVTP